MKIYSISIKKFRSIDSAELKPINGFNVFIGKNNSGKSNMLSAINAFFECITDDNIVTLNPAIGQEIDFFEKNLNNSIQISIVFLLALAERDALIRDIVVEAPQLKNAVDGLDPTLKLLVTVNIMAPPDNFGFVSQISLIHTDNDSGLGSRHAESPKVLFQVNDDAAKELFQKLSQAHVSIETAEVMSDILPNVRQVYSLKGEEAPRNMPFRYLLDSFSKRGSGKLNASHMRELEKIFEQASDAEEFHRAVRSYITQLTEAVSILQDEPLRNKVITFAGEQSAIPNYVRNLLAQIASCKVLYLRERRKQIGPDEAGKLLSLKVTRGGPQVLLNIQETVISLLGVQIDAFESETRGRVEPLNVRRRNEPNAEMDVDNFLADVNGSGIREALRIVLDYEFERPSILLIEEPEIYLHPSLETSMMRYLKRISIDCQVFISTHSTNFLDTGEMKNVYLVSKTNSTLVQLLDYEEAESQIPRELGIRLSALFMFDRLIFVEGPSDEAVIREWASTLRVNLSYHNVGFIHMGGVRNFTHYAAQATLSFLARRQVKMWFIIDRDERDDEEIAKLQAIAGPHGKVEVLLRRELENYLVCPRAIVEFITLKQNLSGRGVSNSPPVEQDVKKTIDDCAEQLKSTALDKQLVKALCSPVYPDRGRIFDADTKGDISQKIQDEFQRLITHLEEAKQKISGVYANQLQQLENTWLSNKLHIVPGDTLLDLVCKEFGVRFKKEQDSPRLAQLMNESEIAQEIQQIIREIGA